MSSAASGSSRRSNCRSLKSMLRFELRSNFGPGASLARIRFVTSPAFAEHPFLVLGDFRVARRDHVLPQIPEILELLLGGEFVETSGGKVDRLRHTRKVAARFTLRKSARRVANLHSNTAVAEFAAPAHRHSDRSRSVAASLSKETGFARCASKPASRA